MALRLHRLGRWCAQHAKSVLALWLAVLVCVGVAAAGFGSPMTSEIVVPGSDFKKVLTNLEEEVPEASSGAGNVVLHSTDGSFSQEQRTAIKQVFQEWEELPQVKRVADPFENQQRLEGATEQLRVGREDIEAGQERLDEAWRKISLGQGQIAYGKAWIKRFRAEDPNHPMIADIRSRIAEGRPELAEAKEKYHAGEEKLEAGRARYASGKALRAEAGDRQFVTDDGYALAQIAFDRNAQSVDPEVKQAIPTIGEQLEDVGVETAYSVEITQENSLIGPGEVVGLLIAGIVLLLALGSLVATGLPLAGALVGVGAGIGGAIATTYFFDMHSLTPALALMLGLAVGIDYALFIVSRHRTELLSGRPVTASIAHAVGTAGSAVVVAGTTVAIALVALVVAPIPLLAQMGLVAAATVAVAVLVALTLTPALMRLAGTRVLSRRAWIKAGFVEPGIPGEGVGRAGGHERTGGGYVDAVTRRPWLAVLAVVAVCGIMAIPATSLRLGLPDGSTEPLGSSAQTAYAQTTEHFGEGANGPIIVVANLDSVPEDDDAILAARAEIAQRIGTVHGVDTVVPYLASDDGSTLAFQVLATTGPADAETVETVHMLKASTPAIGEATSSELGVTGQTVASIEVSQQLGDALPSYLAIVIGLSLVLLTIVFRSVIVPLIATAGFLLSVAASFGAAVAVYQWTWLGDLLAVHAPGPILSFMPIMLIGVLFGLAMDYQMFLVSGMREAHAHGADARSAVRTGFNHGATVVLAAALIMAAVFAGFIFAHMTMIRPIAFALAVGVLVDALLVRMTLTPAVMHLLGESAWWMPRWLDRVLPDLDVEGTALEAQLAEQAEQVDSAAVEPQGDVDSVTDSAPEREPAPKVMA